jgi:hypothetical protein
MLVSLAWRLVSLDCRNGPASEVQRSAFRRPPTQASMAKLFLTGTMGRAGCVRQGREPAPPPAISGLLMRRKILGAAPDK